MKPDPVQRLGNPGGLAEPDKAKSRWPRLVVVMLAIAVLAGVGGYAYENLTREGPVTSQQVPLIKADDSPTKKRPDEPGGMAIPDQDKLVYQALSEGGGEEVVERILPPPEEPMPMPLPLPQDIEPAAGPEAAPASTDAPEAVAEVPPAPEPAAASAEVAAVAPAPTVESVAVAAVAAEADPPPTASPTGKNYLVQLAALRSADAANEAWRRLAKANADLLGELQPKVVRVDLGAEKGVFFRLRVGPLRDAATAKDLCAKLKARKMGCLVIRP